MTDLRNALQSMFEEPNRYTNFGNVLIQIHIQGFRCHANTVVDIESPITAFSGLNGTGKSTILQLAAAAYKNPDHSTERYYIRDFLVVGILDPNPFTTNAIVEYKFWQDDRSHKSLKISRKAISKRWQGYKSCPERCVFFAGIGLYLPMNEKRDFIFCNASRLNISSSNNVSTNIKEWTCKILGQNYNNIASNTVTYSQKIGQVISVQRSGITYSEAHMGCGEGRSQFLINMLETLPEKSLVLIEEPETSLHPSAQHEFGRYLVDVVKRKRHQILLTTHSEFILESLPSKSRIYLKKTNDSIKAIPGLTALQAKSLMSDGHVKALDVLVEDFYAKEVLCEMIRRIDPDFLRSIGIHPSGDSDIIAKTVKILKSTGLAVAAVRDADKGPNPRENIFKLPGNQPPEKDLFANSDVKTYIMSNYNVDLDDFSARLIDVDHHDWFKNLADYININEHALVCEVAKVYARSLPENEVSGLITQLKEASVR